MRKGTLRKLRRPRHHREQQRPGQLLVIIADLTALEMHTRIKDQIVGLRGQQPLFSQFQSLHA